MTKLVFQVWKSCFQHAANGYLVMHSPWGIFDISIAFLDPENVDFDVLYAILLTFGSPHYAFLCWCRPSWNMVPCVNRTHFRRCHHAVSWSPHHTPVIDFRQQTNIRIRLPVPFSYGGLCCSTTILCVGKICIYASQSYTLLMFNGTYVLKMNKNYIYDVTQYVTKYVVTDRFA